MWEDEVLKWQMLFGNEWVSEQKLFDADVLKHYIPVGLYEVQNKIRTGGGMYRLKSLGQRETMQTKWDRQQDLHKKLNTIDRIKLDITKERNKL